MWILKNNSGFGSLMAVLMLMVLSMAGATSMTLMSTDQSGRTMEWSKRQSFYLNQAALEYAQHVVTQGGDPNVVNKPFGPGTFSVTMAGSQVAVSSQVGVARQDNSMTVTLPPPPPPPEDPPPPPPDVDDGEVTVPPDQTVTVEALCSQIQSGSKTVPVTAGIKINGVYQSMFGGQVVPPNGGVTFTTDSGPSGSTYVTKGIAKISRWNTRAYWSTNTVQVKTLVDGQTPPNVPGFNGQMPITECVALYLDAEGNIQLQTNQVIYLFELGVNAYYYPNHPATDFQDLVLLMTVGGE